MKLQTTPEQSLHIKNPQQKDYTQTLINFLRQNHQGVRQDESGDYHYQKVSAISLYFLLKTSLPQAEVLWCWYQFFEEKHGESIYRTISPQEDERFLELLSSANFVWDASQIKNSGWVFLSSHKREIYLLLEEFLSMNLDALENLPEEDIALLLTPRELCSEARVEKILSQVLQRGLSLEQRKHIYKTLSTNYLRATAKNILEQARRKAFWVSPPPELEGLKKRIQRSSQLLIKKSKKLGLYTSKETHSFQGFTERAPEKELSAWTKTCFYILGIEPSSDLQSIKSAYRGQVKHHHPDQGGSVPKFLQLQTAYEHLVDWHSSLDEKTL